MRKVPVDPVAVAGVAYEEARLDALSQPTMVLRLMRRRLARQKGFLHRAQRQAVERELAARNQERPSWRSR